MINLMARVNAVEGGVVHLRLRGGRGNRIVETWRIFHTIDSESRIRAERYDPAGGLLAGAEHFYSATAALGWLSESAWLGNDPDTLGTYPAEIVRALKKAEAQL